MAFANPVFNTGPDLPQRLTQLLVDPKRTCNISRQMTFGLKALYQRIKVSMMTRDSLFSDDNEYVIRQKIAQGTFSSIHLARSIEGSKVVVKQIDKKYDVLAYREVIFLRHLFAKARHGIYQFLRPRDFYELRNTLIIVLDVYDLTLYSTIHRAAGLTRNASEAAEDKSEVYIPKPKRQCTIQGVSRPALQQEQLSSPRRIRALRLIAAKLMVALYTLRTENIIHADIKPENLLIRLPSHCEVSIASINDISKLPDDFEMHVGDFGNAFHISESQKFYESFNLQSMPYRSPEILLGVPFSTQIDMWSLGIVLLEAYIGQEFFDVASSEELFLAIGRELTCIPLHRFIGGKFSELFSLQAVSVPKLEHSMHMQSMHRLLRRYPMPPALFHLLCALLHPDPDERLNPVEGLRHEFIVAQVHLPHSLLVHKSTITAKRQQGIAKLRRGIENTNSRLNITDVG